MERVAPIPGDGANLELTEVTHRGLEATRVELAGISELEAEVAT